jgi:hypothetical protein
MSPTTEVLSSRLFVIRRVYVRGGGVNVPRGDVAVPPYADRGF